VESGTLYCFGGGGCGDVVAVAATCRYAQEGVVYGLRDTVSDLLKRSLLGDGKIAVVAQKVCIEDLGSVRSNRVALRTAALDVLIERWMDEVV